MADYFERPTISHELALKIVSKAISEGEKVGVAVSVAVVDTTLNLVAFVKTDNATPHSAETSKRKANTAASTRKPTGWMDDTLAVALPLATGNLLTNIPGGLPISIDSKHVGAFGIAGGTVEQDQAIAEATLKGL